MGLGTDQVLVGLVVVDVQYHPAVSLEEEEEEEDADEPPLQPLSLLPRLPLKLLPYFS